MTTSGSITHATNHPRAAPGVGSPTSADSVELSEVWFALADVKGTGRALPSAAATRPIFFILRGERGVSCRTTNSTLPSAWSQGSAAVACAEGLKPVAHADHDTDRVEICATF